MHEQDMIPRPVVLRNLQSTHVVSFRFFLCRFTHICILMVREALKMQNCILYYPPGAERHPAGRRPAL